MYSKRIIHKSFVDNNAYITIGDPYATRNENPFRVPAKGEKQKGFDIPRQPKNAENGMFSKVSYQAGGYTETIKYKALADDERKGFGFGSKNASRRDEFSNTIRTEQYRETLRKEHDLLKKSGASEKVTLLLAERAANEMPAVEEEEEFNYGGAIAQYDIGRTRVTQFDPKSTKDAYYRFDSTRGRKTGNYKPTSCEVGDAAWEINYKPPQHGGRSEVKNFFDKSHLNVGPGV